MPTVGLVNQLYTVVHLIVLFSAILKHLFKEGPYALNTSFHSLPRPTK